MGIQTNDLGYITSYYAEDLLEFMEVGHKEFKIILSPANTAWIEEEAMKREYTRKEIKQEDGNLEEYFVTFEKKS